MSQSNSRNRLLELLTGEYGMLVVLVLLAALFAVLTITERTPEGAKAGRALANKLIADHHGQRAAIAAQDTDIGKEFIAALEGELGGSGVELVASGVGNPRAIRKALDAAGEFDVLALQGVIQTDLVFDRYTGEGKATKVTAPSSKISVFLTPDNLRNIASQIAVIAIIAIGMTMVIITAGIDLSVGSMVALAAVVAALIIKKMGGAEDAGTMALVIASLAGVAVCALAGAFTGWMVVGFCVPPFIATLAMMQVLRGGAFKLADNQTVYDVPDSYQWLGTGLTFGIPNCVILMLVLYLTAHVLMSKTKLGRYIYATGGNPEAARLSGVSPKRIKLIVYSIAGALAGVGGIVEASQLKGGAGTMGEGYELHVIAAVVVGGTSLFGGKGKIFGTLIGAFIIAVIKNGMNLTKLGSETQMIVLGAVILLAVLLERIRSGEWKSAVGG